MLCSQVDFIVIILIFMFFFWLAYSADFLRQDNDVLVWKFSRKLQFFLRFCHAKMISMVLYMQRTYKYCWHIEQATVDGGFLLIGSSLHMPPTMCHTLCAKCRLTLPFVTRQHRPFAANCWPIA